MTKDFDLCINQTGFGRILKSNDISNHSSEAVEIVNRGLMLANETLKPILSL